MNFIIAVKASTKMVTLLKTSIIFAFCSALYDFDNLFSVIGHNKLSIKYIDSFQISFCYSILFFFVILFQASIRGMYYDFIIRMYESHYMDEEIAPQLLKEDCFLLRRLKSYTTTCLLSSYCCATFTCFQSFWKQGDGCLLDVVSKLKNRINIDHVSHIIHTLFPLVKRTSALKQTTLWHHISSC